MNTRVQRRTSAAAGSPAPVSVEEAEAALVEHYPKLVRLAYLTLPPSLGRHRRVLTAHRLTQGALPRSKTPGRGGTYALLRREVLRAALEFGSGGLMRTRLRVALEHARLPAVAGLKVAPRATAAGEPALERALSALSAPARAAYLLRTVDGLSERGAAEVLRTAGAADPEGALRAVAVVGRAQERDGERDRSGGPVYAGPGGGSAAALGGGGGFPSGPCAEVSDPCTLHVRPADLLRRRRFARGGLVTAAVLGAGALAVAMGTAGSSSQPYTASGTPGGDPHALDPAAVVRLDATAWQSTTRMDFSAWPARGSRTSDSALLGRALAVWAHPGASVDVSSTPGTPRTGPSQPPQLLFAGTLDNATVVLFYDGLRVVRYAQPRTGGGRAALDFAQVPDAGMAASSALLVDRVDGNARFLTAPWITAAGTRDLLHPTGAETTLHRDSDGVTDPVRLPGGMAGKCGGTWEGMVLRSSRAVDGGHGFLLTDMGDLTPTHLTYTPPTGGRSPASAPQEATGAQALASWAHGVCGLLQLRGQSVRSVNDWEFARAALPEGAGEASWTCERAETWRGPGLATVGFVAPGRGASAAASVVGRQADGTACSAFAPHVVAGAMWQSPGGSWYLLAAADGAAERITASDGVTASADGSRLAVRAPRGTTAVLAAHLPDGTTVAPLPGDG